MQRDRGHTPFLAQLQDWDSERLFAAADAIRALQVTPGWAVMTRMLELARNSAEDRMRYGKILEQAEYARNLGVITGLESVEKAGEAILLRAEAVQKQLEAAAEKAEA